MTCGNCMEQQILPAYLPTSLAASAALRCGCEQVESSDALPNLEEIVEAADCVMVARGDLGAQVSRPLCSWLCTPAVVQ